MVCICPVIGDGLVAKLCLTLCNAMGYSLPGSSVHGAFQARIMVWAAISFSRGSSPPRDQTWVSSYCCSANKSVHLGLAIGRLNGKCSLIDSGNGSASCQGRMLCNGASTEGCSGLSCRVSKFIFCQNEK